MRIPVFVNGEKVGFVRDEGALRRYVGALNVEVEFGRGCVKRINVASHRDDWAREHSVGPGSTLPTYQEGLETGRLCMLKRVDGGQLVRWSDADSFAPGRFNPDRIARSLVAALA